MADSSSSRRVTHGSTIDRSGCSIRLFELAAQLFDKTFEIAQSFHDMSGLLWCSCG